MRLIDADRLRKEIERLKAAAEGWSREYACGITAGLSMAQLRVGEAPTIAPPPNEPLTVDELREMNGEIWVCYPQETWGGLSEGAIDCTRYEFRLDNYGKTWLAYRRKPNAKEDKSDA